MSDELTVLKVFITEMDANMARDILQDDGVEAFVFKDDGGGTEPHLQRTNGVRVMVHPVDVERARKILKPLLG